MLCKYRTLFALSLLAQGEGDTRLKKSLAVNFTVLHM